MGWLFVTPLIVILGLFLVLPILMALWVSLTNWNGSVNPFGGGPGAEFVGARNYTDLFAKDGLTRSTFMQSLGNTFWYVLLVVRIQTVSPRQSRSRPSTRHWPWPSRPATPAGR